MKNINKPYLIAETAFHHEGDVEFMEKLIDNAVETTADAIKFHLLLDIESYMISSHQTIDLVRNWIFTKNQWTKFINKASKNKLDVILLCNDVESVRFVCNEHPDVKAIEIHASGLNDYFLLKEALNFKGTIILGVGGSTIDEIQYAIEFLKSNGKDDIFLMYGFQSFPTDYTLINLSKMHKLQVLFNLPVGYTDHTDPADSDLISVSTMAAAMGFFVLEKHFTHVYGEKRIDHQAAISIPQMKEIKQRMELYFKVFGNGSLELSDAEKAYGNTGPMKKAIVAKNNIAKGEKLSFNNLWFKRTNESSYIPQNKFIQLLNAEALTDIEKDEIISFDKVKYIFNKYSFSEFKPK